MFARLLDVGQRMFVDCPVWYSLTRFAFMTNKALEEFAMEHNRKYEPEELWSVLDGADVLRTHHAIKVDATGLPLSDAVATKWDGASNDVEKGGRAYVAGATACYLHFKWG